MKLAIVGSRDFADYKTLADIVDKYFRNGVLSLVSGGASGADALAEKYAKVRDVPIAVFKADWDKHGKAAGPLRNQLIVENCDIVLCFWDGKSRGTASTLSLAKKAKKPTIIVYF